MPTPLRFKCPQCGMVQDVAGNGPCWKCHVMIHLPEDGVIQILRTLRTKLSMEIYINGIELALSIPSGFQCHMVTIMFW